RSVENSRRPNPIDSFVSSPPRAPRGCCPVRDRQLAWALVWLYPPSFRRDVGLGLVDAMEDRMRARRSAGASSFGARMPAGIDARKTIPGGWIQARPDARAHPAPQSPAPKGRSMVDTLRQDIRYALRLSKRRPGFALVAILTLAIGIGANTAMFTIVNAVILRPLPYAHADRLVTVYGRTPAFARGLVSYREFEEVSKQRDAFDAMALWLTQSVNVTGVDEPQRLIGTFVTASFFDVLGLRAERGRFFTAEESAPGTVKSVVVISHNTWLRRFNGDETAIGRTMTL